jgi:Tfp pilus assembly protein PilO
MSIRRLNVIVVGSVLGLTALFLAALLLPGVRDLRRQRARIGEELQAVAARQQEVGHVGELYASNLEMERQVREQRRQLPADRQFGEFLNALSESLRRRKIGQYVVQPGPEQTLDEARLPDPLRVAAGTAILPVRISFEGSFAQVFDFLKDVEDLPRLSHVESMKVRNDEHGPGRVRAEIVLHTFHQPGAAPAAAVIQ